ncbi:pseudouridine synthase [Acidobacteria bacterium Mor1]|nr:pseudouridine synthase [Acidobacteria bacterium Mor1]
MNQGYTYRAVVESSAPVGVVDYLARRWPHSDAEQWRARVEAGEVRLDRIVAATDAVVRQGQELCWDRPPWREPAAPLDYRVLFEDEALLGVDKPSGLPTLPGAGFLENTLLSRVQQDDPGSVPLHRLGRHTSGIVLFARTPGARSALARDWAGKRVGKRYRALALGRPERQEFTIDQPIGPVTHAPLGNVHAATPDGKQALSRVRVVLQEATAFLADVEIETGRPHQVRIHLASVGHPLVGDPLYGPGGRPVEGMRAIPGDPGYLLHACELRFRHPTSGQAVRLRSAPPAGLRAASDGFFR